MQKFVFGLTASFMLMGLVWQDHMAVHQREPAGSRAGAIARSCFGSMNSLLKPYPNMTRYWYEIGNGLPRFYKFETGKFERLKKQYIEILEAGREVVELDKSPEGMMALIEAVNRKTPYQKSIEDYKNMGWLKRRRIHKVFRSINADGKVRMNDLNDHMADLYMSVYGRGLRFRDFLRTEEATRQLLARIVQEDLAARGLRGFFEKYGNNKVNPNAVYRFLRSKKGKGLGMVLFNLPTLSGFPPLYLPGAKPFLIPDELAEKMLKEGFTDENFKALEKALNGEIEGLEIFGFEGRERYRILRHYYMIGAGILGTGLFANMVYDDLTVTEEEAAWNETVSLLEELGEDVESLKERGYNLYSADTDENMNPYCEAVRECLKVAEEEKGVLPEKGSPEYKSCKDLFDPLNNCENL